MTSAQFPSVGSIFTTIGILALYVVGLFGVFFLRKLKVGPKKKPLNFGIVVLIVMGVGAIIGQGLRLLWNVHIDLAVGVNAALEWLNIVQNIFIAALTMIVVPIILIAIIRSVLSAGGGKDSAKAGVRTISILALTVGLSALFGYLLVIFLPFDMDVFKLGGTASNEPATIIQTITDIVPKNMFAAFTANRALPIIFIALALGFSMSIVNKENPEMGAKLKYVIEMGYEVIGTLVDLIIKCTPYAVLAIITVNMATNSIAVLAQVGLYVGATYIGLVLVFLMQEAVVALFGINPIAYAKRSASAWLYSFSIQSSMAALPITVKTLKEMGVEESTATMAGSFGTCMGQNT